MNNLDEFEVAIKARDAVRLNAYLTEMGAGLTHPLTEDDVAELYWQSFGGKKPPHVRLAEERGAKAHK